MKLAAQGMRLLEGKAMKTRNEFMNKQSMAGCWGRFMRNRFSGNALGVVLLLASASVWAETVVTDANFRTNSSGGVSIVLSTQGDAPTVSVFATDSPARIVLDLADTESDVDSSAVSVGQGVVEGFTTLGAGGRTRLMVDLSRMAEYDYRAESGQVVLEIAGGSSSMSSGSASGSDLAVESIDFRRGENGQSRIIVSMSREGANVAVNSQGGRVKVDIYDASLPTSLSQRIDVVDFATPVQMIDASQRGSSVGLDMSVNVPVEHLSYQSGNDVVIEVSELTSKATEEAEVLFYEEKEYSGSRVTFNFQDIPVRSVLQLIADVSELNIVVADNVTGNLTLRLKNVPWDQALDIVLDARNLDMRENGNVIWIAPTAVIAQREQQLLQAAQDRKELEPLVTRLIEINYSTAEDLVTLIEESSEQNLEEQGLLSERGSVAYDERTNTLLVTDTLDRVEEIERLVGELDRPVRQVQIESRIVIANSDFAHELGVRFGVTALHQGSNILAIAGDGAGADLVNPATNPRDDGLIDLPGIPQRYNVNLPSTATSASSIGLSFLSGDWLLDLELSALEAEGEGEVISTPRIVTANQAEAFIQQGVEIPYEQSTSSGATAVQFKEAVLELRVTPLITPDDRVQLELEIKQDTVGEIYETGQGGTVPSIDTRELNTSVLVNNGETVVLGGIFQDERARSSDKVPFLGDIPGLGYLFKRNANELRKRELLIFVTPTIVEDRPSVN
jgi:type IV pilus assembly protein PilQ